MRFSDNPRNVTLENSQIQIFNQCQDIILVFLAYEGLDFLAPGCVTVHVRKSDHITAIQDFQSLIELALSSGGQPNVVRH